MKIRIEIKNNHIANGIRFSAASCPIALAIKDRIKENYSIGVTDCVRIYYNGRLYHSTSNEWSKVFIGLFDNGYPCYESAFIFDLPEEVLK